MENRFLVILIIALCVSSCKVIKDTNALNRVEGNVNLLNHAGNEWQKLHPCTIDSVITYINGTPVITYDTVYSQSTVYDTAHKIDVQVKTVYITKKIHDTATVIKIDTRALQIANNALNTANGRIAQLTQDGTNKDKTNRTKTAWQIGEGVVILLLFVALIYTTIKLLKL